MVDYEKLGAFYLGRTYDVAARAPVRDDLVLYPSKHLTTHGVCVGMTGSGKTGLCVGLLEEAAIDGIPVLAIDPKGDLSNLALTFPDLAPSSFAAWVDPAEAERNGTTVDALGAELAARWTAGLAEHHQDAARIARLRAAADVVVYTPGSRAGVQLALLPSFDAPSEAELEDAEAFGARVASAVGALLGLARVGDVDPQGREHVLLSQILGQAWAAGKSLDLAALVQAVQRPGFDRVGVLDLESFYPAKDRMALVLALNAILASPAAAQWTQGEPRDVARMLYAPSGRPRVAVVSIAHLDDAQRMFFVSTLLGRVISWMRAQPGTSSLRALLYMDEIFGYFPPIASPPSKGPMLLLLKQARAFGLGVVLATQNPVDLDYKGLANCGTWWIGRLQTERDKLRVLDGLEAALQSAGRPTDRGTLDRLLSGLGSRVFLMHDVHAGQPRTFETRWTMSYLRGPLTREELGRLKAQRPPDATARGPTHSAGAASAVSAAASPAASSGARPVVAAELVEAFLPAEAGEGALTYKPALLAEAKAHYVQAKTKLDAWRTWTLLLPLAPDEVAPDWASADVLTDALGAALGTTSDGPASRTPEDGARFDAAPALVSSAKALEKAKKAVSAHVYEARPLTVFTAPALGLRAEPGESRAAFVARVALAAREARDAAVEALEAKYAPKLTALDDKLRRAAAKVDAERADVSAETMNTAVTMGSAIFGALFGRKVLSSANVGRASSSVRAASRTAKARQDVARAEDAHAALEGQRAELEAELQAAAEALQAQHGDAERAIQELTVAPRKADTTIVGFGVAWIPHRVDSSGVVSSALALEVAS